MTNLDQILKECRQYNNFAQKLLYQMYVPKMMGLCFRYIGDTEITKDIVQEGFIKVFLKIKQFDGKGSFEGWMKRIFINTAISFIRKQNKRNRNINFDNVSESDILENESNVVDNQLDIDTSKDNIELVLLADLSEEELLQALQQIPEKFRTVFNLFCIEHIKHEEIAQMLGIDIATSRTRLSRARSLIKKELYTFCRVKLKA